MNIYAAYLDSSKNDKNLLLIKQGFSLTAGLFNIFWALYHKLWYLSLICLILNLLLVYINITTLTELANIFISLIFCFFASDFREYYAKKKKFNLVDIIAAKCEEEAEARFIASSEAKF